MRLEADFSLRGFEKLVMEDLERRNRAIMNAYIQAGETFLILARTKTRAEGGFGDITGNLRSSISYAVYNDRQNVHDRYFESEKGSDRATGIAHAKTYQQEIAREIPMGWVLVVTAGMNYASAVESRNKDVISGTALNMIAILEDLLKTAA